MAMMNAQLPALRAALAPGQTPDNFWVVATIGSCGRAPCHRARTGGDPISQALLAVAVSQLDTFVRGEF